MDSAAIPKPGKGKWYYGITAVLIALVLFGPLAYPLLWKSPRFNLLWKILITLVFTLLTAALILSTWELFKVTWQELERIGLIQ